MRTIIFCCLMLVAFMLASCAKPVKLDNNKFYDETYSAITKNVDVKISVTKKKFQLNENINVSTIIRNNFTNAIKLKIEDWNVGDKYLPMFALINEKEEIIVDPPSSLPDFKHIELKPNTEHKVNYNVQKLLSIEKTGKYRLVALVDVTTEAGRVVSLRSNEIEFEIVE